MLAAGDFYGRVYVFSVDNSKILLSGKAPDRVTRIRWNLFQGASQYLLTATDNGVNCAFLVIF